MAASIHGTGVKNIPGKTVVSMIRRLKTTILISLVRINLVFYAYRGRLNVAKFKMDHLKSLS